MSLSFEELRLAPIMEKRARELAAQFPGLIRYTSGRRTMHDQARVMVMNHLQDKTYLARTYKNGILFQNVVSKRLSAEDMIEALYDLFTSDPSVIDARHAHGNAVDLRPLEYENGEPTAIGAQVIDWIKACPDTVDFRTREGRLRRWHWACTPSTEV